MSLCLSLMSPITKDPDTLSMTSGAAGAIPFAITGSAPPICRALGALWWPDTQPRALVWLAEETEAAGRGATPGTLETPPLS